MSFGIPVRNGLSISLLSTTSLSSGRGLRPSLALNFLSGTLDSRIDFTRTSAATYVDATGKIVSTPASRNLLTFTQEFDNAAWGKFVSASVTANTTTAPDGTATADTLTLASTANSRIEQTVTVSSGQTYTFSVWMRVASGTLSVRLYGIDAGGGSAFTVNTDWQRFSLTQVASSGTRFPAIVTNGTAGNVFIWGAQLEAGSTATDYTRNFGGVYPPRFDYDPVTLAPRGLLVEEQRTNLLLRSEDFTTVWVNSSITITANSTAAPDRTTTADTLTSSGSTSTLLGQSIAFTGDGTKSVSIFLKAGTSTSSVFFLRDSTAAATRGSATITWGSGVPTATAGNGGTIEAVENFGDGWYRIKLLCAGVIAANTNILRIQPDNVVGTGSIIVWGAQAENGSFATSYIPTVASQVTRSADVATITGANFSQWYNQSEGSWTAEFMPYSVTGSVVAQISGATNGDRFQLLNDNAAQIAVTTGSAGQGVIDAGTLNAGAVNNLAYAYRTNDTAASLNGGAAVADTNVTLPTVDRLCLGATVTPASFLNGHLRSIRYYNTRLPNAQLQALTA